MSRIIISTLALLMVLTVTMCNEDFKIPPGYVDMTSKQWETHISNRGEECSAEWKAWIKNDKRYQDSPDNFHSKFQGGRLNIQNLSDLVVKINEIYPTGENQLEKGIMVLNDFNVEIPGEKDDAVDVYVTYYVHSAGYYNRLLMYRKLEDGEKCTKSEQCDPTAGIMNYVIFEQLNSFDYDCLLPGMTVRRKLRPGKYGFALQANYHKTTKYNTFYSDWYLGNPGHLISSDNVGHTTSSNLLFKVSESNTVPFQLLGFEDQIGGDDDYNDVMFSIFVPGGKFTDTPIVDDLIYGCVDVKRVPQYSYAEGSCSATEPRSYGYLELPSYPQDSPYFLSPSNGWDYVPFDEDAKAVIRSNPEYHKKCIGFVSKGDNSFSLQAHSYNPSENVFSACDEGEFQPLKVCNDGSEKYKEVCKEGYIEVSCFNVQKVDFKILIAHELPCSSLKCDEENNREEKYPASEGAVDTVVYPQKYHITYVSDEGALGSQDFDFHLKSVTNQAGKTVVNVAYVIYNPRTSAPYTFNLDNFDLNEYDVRAAIYRYDEPTGRLITLKSFYDEDSPDVLTFDQAGSGRFDKNVMKKITGHNYGWNEGALKILTIIHGKESYETVQEDDVPELYHRNAAVVLLPTNSRNSGFSSSGYENLYFKSANSGSLVRVMESIIDGPGCIIPWGEGLKINGDELESRCVETGGNVVLKLNAPYGQGKSSTIYAIGRDKLTITKAINNPPVYNGRNVNFYFVDGAITEQYVNLYSHWNDPEGDKLTFEKITNVHDGYDITVTEEGVVSVKLNGQPEFLNTVKYSVSDGCKREEGEIKLNFDCANNASCLGPACKDFTYDLRRHQSVDLWEDLKKGAYFEFEGANGEYGWDYSILSYTDSIEKFFDEEDNFGLGQVHGKLNFTFTDEVITLSRYDIVYKALASPFPRSNEEISAQCRITINILPSNHPPQIDDQSGYSFEDETYYFNIDEEGVVYEEQTGDEPERRMKIKYISESGGPGNLRCCHIDKRDYICKDCSEIDEPHFIEQMIFEPEKNDYGDCDVETTELKSDCLYKTVTFCIYDVVHELNGVSPLPCREIDYLINIIPVNDRPAISELSAEAEKIDNTQSNIYELEKGNDDEITFKVKDIDTLPGSLSAFISGRLFYGRYNMYACTENECSVEISSGDQISPIRVVDDDCPNQDALKEALGSDLENCYAEFKFKFVPTKDSYSPPGKPLITFTMEGFDGLLRSSPAYISYFVTAVNLPPTVESPEEIESASKTISVVLDDEYVTIWDDAPPTHHKLIEIEMSVVEGEGKFIFPEDMAGLECEVKDDNGGGDPETQEDESEVIVCGRSDYNTINIWLQRLKFEITEGDEARVKFVARDGGYPNTESPPGKESEPSYTTFIYEEVVSIPPVKNNSTLTIIAASVGAAAAIALGLLVFFLRKAIKPPADDYFNIGADTVSGTPTNPIYSAQTVENVSPYYRGA